MVSYGEEQRDPLLAQQRHEMAVVEGELAYNEAVIEEREQGIQEIQQQIVEVNEIFQDLAVLVREQGGMIDDIEANIEGSRAQAVNANKQPQAAHEFPVCPLLALFCDSSCRRHRGEHRGVEGTGSERQQASHPGSKESTRVQLIYVLGDGSVCYCALHFLPHHVCLMCMEALGSRC
ncbi:unnamed protein product [Closterium sp. NIES-54]